MIELVALTLFSLALSVTCHIQTDYSYYVLALKKCNSTSPWTLHGLWPELNSHAWPQYCHPAGQLSYHQLRHLFPRMYTNWTDCTPIEQGGNWDFWTHEWSKHGTCSGMNQTDYFTKALDLYDNVWSDGAVDGMCPGRGNLEPTWDCFWVREEYRGDWYGQCMLPMNLNGSVRWR
jgi:ribonuclease T2